MIDRALVDMLRSALRCLAAGEIDETRGLIEQAAIHAEQTRICLHVQTKDLEREEPAEHTRVFEVVIDDGFAELYEPLVQGRMERDVTAIVFARPSRCPVRFSVEVKA